MSDQRTERPSSTDSHRRGAHARSLASRKALDWVHQHDRGYAALRRAGRTAIVLPGLFAIGVKVLDNPEIALFASFGSIALLLFADFTGLMRNRLEAQVALSLAGALLICVATLASRAVWSAALFMAVVGFLIVFLAVVSSVIAGATTALLLAFILPVSIAAPASAIPDRLAGWGLASGAALIAVWLLWPAPVRSPLRSKAAAACRALAASLRASVPEDSPPGGDEGSVHKASGPSEAVASLEHEFLATPWRPTGLGASDRAVVRLVDELAWLDAIVSECDAPTTGSLIGLSLAVQSRAADALDEAAAALERHPTSPESLQRARRELTGAMSAVESHLEGHLSIDDGPSPASTFRPSREHRVDRFLASLEFNFRSREIGYATTRIATDVEHAVEAERRSFLQRVLGHEAGGAGLWSSARSRIGSHLQRHSVWLHNSVRAAVGLTIAVLIAEEVSLEHSFWIILGTLSVLRSNALSTGQNVLRAILGTLAGFVLGALVVEAVGTNVTLLWFLLPLALLIAGVAPTAISFAAGQAGFTLTLVILFNILEPAGWRVGLVRIEDVAAGCAISAGVALLLWPRGAAAELGGALGDAYRSGVSFLAAATSGRVKKSQRSEEGERAAAASRRLDDAFRTYLAERGAKPVPLSEVTTLVTGVAILRLSADAVADLWDQGLAVGDEWRVARERLDAATTEVVAWFAKFCEEFDQSGAARLVGPDHPSDGGVKEAVRAQLVSSRSGDGAVALAFLWTADQLEAVRRLEAKVAEAARSAGVLWISRARPARGVGRTSPRASAS